MQCTCNCSPTKSDLTLARRSFQCQVGSMTHKTKLRWSFSHICLHIVASSNKQLHFCYEFSMIVLIMLRLYLRHEVPALAHEGMRQRAVAECMGHVTRLDRFISARALTAWIRKWTFFKNILWNENWQQNHQQPTLVPWLPYLSPHKEALVEWQPPPSPLGTLAESYIR